MRNTLQEAANAYYADHPDLETHLVSLEFRQRGDAWVVVDHKVVWQAPVLTWEQDPRYWTDQMSWPCGAQIQIRTTQEMGYPEREFDLLDTRHSMKCTVCRTTEEE